MYQRRRRTVAVAALLLIGGPLYAVTHRSSEPAPAVESSFPAVGKILAAVPLPLAAGSTNLPFTGAMPLQITPAAPSAGTSGAPTGAPSTAPSALGATPTSAPSANPSANPTPVPEQTFVLPGVTPLAKPADPTAVPRLDPQLAAAWSQAKAAAAAQGVTLTLASGSRSWAKQAELHARAVARHGGEANGSQWVLPPQYSMHVRGQALDIAAGASWLEKNGSQWGLCRRYVNEPWHFERVTTPGGTCPVYQANAAG